MEWFPSVKIQNIPGELIDFLRKNDSEDLLEKMKERLKESGKYLARVDEDQRRISFVFKFGLFWVSKAEKDGEGWIQIERPGHPLHDVEF